MSLCVAALTALAEGPKPIMVWSTYLGVADCDSVALWRDNALLACHSPESRLPVPVLGSKARHGLMGAYVLRVDLVRNELVLSLIHI